MADRIGKKDFEEKVSKSEIPVLVDFYSDSCIACKKLAPALAQAEELLGDGFSFYKVNTNFESGLTEQFGIMANPTLIVFRGGQEAGRKTGAQSPQELTDWLRSFEIVAK